MRTSLIGLGVVGLATTAVLWPGNVFADTGVARAYVDGDTLYYTAGYGQTNEVTVTQGPDSEFDLVIDDRVPIRPGADCVRHDPDDNTTVTCTFASGPEVRTQVIVDLHDRDDTLSLQAGDERVAYGGDGDDFLDGPQADELWGEGGDDIIVDARFAHGSDGNDLIMGSDKADELIGGPGDDTIHGMGGGDTVYGNSGSDELRGGLGDDRLYGGPQPDLLYGNSGDDLLHGGPGADRFSGGPGNDDVRQD